MLTSSCLLRRTARTAWLFCLLLLMISPKLWAQSTTDGAISVTVTAASGAAVADSFLVARHLLRLTGINNTGYIVSTSGTVTTSAGTAACSSSAPCLSYNSVFGTVASSNSNFAFSPRQIQIGFRFLF
jgi:hypothetical protein